MSILQIVIGAFEMGFQIKIIIIEIIRLRRNMNKTVFASDFFSRYDLLLNDLLLFL